MKTYQEALPIYLERIAEGEDKLEAVWSALWEPGDYVTDQQAREFLQWVYSLELPATK